MGFFFWFYSETPGLREKLCRLFHFTLGDVENFMQSKKLKFMILFFYNTFNAFLLFIVLRGAFVIHGDGPVGFGEFIVKSFMLGISWFSFIVGFVSIRMINKEEGRNIGGYVFLCASVMVVLMLLCGVMVFDACANSQGYCRDWAIHFQ